MNRESEFSPFEIISGDPNTGIVLIADHALNLVPKEYGDLGLEAEEFERHIAYDIGVDPVIRKLAGLLNAPAVIARFSRLLIDPNRGIDDPTLIRQIYDGSIVGGNYPLTQRERQKRIDFYYNPYHKAVAETIAATRNATQKAPLIISIHSFTPSMQGRDRPWHVGILWDKDQRAAKPLIQHLRDIDGVIVGDNEPYDGALRGDTMFQHATVHGYAHALIEIRQDLIACDEGAAKWASLLAPILEELNLLPDIHSIAMFGSRTDPSNRQIR